MLKRTICTLSAALFFINTSVYAGVFGDITGGYTNEMGFYGFFHKTEFDGTARGRQTEHYIEYIPNEDIVPVMVDGEQLWGTIDIYEANNYITSNGYRSRGAINADYFSFKTGLQMGYTISDGEIVSKENVVQPAVGFRKDGTAFIDDLQIKTTVSNGNNSVDVMYINKWCQPGFDPIYLLTDKLGDTTKTNSNCLYVICSADEGTLSIGKELKLNVDESFVYNGTIKIPDGKYVFQIDVGGGEPACLEFLRSLRVGDKITVSNEAINSEKNLWSEAVEGSSTVGGRLLKNGNIGSGFEAGVHPRTAVGIKADGTVIFYTLDGRQSGYSMGASLEELAKRLLELGCVDAINFDGGGSTVIGAWLSDRPGFEVLNRPSEGSVRNVANYIFLRDNRTPTGIPKIINYKNIMKNVYIGSGENIEIESVYDTSEYEMTDYTMELSSEKAAVDGSFVVFDTEGEVTVDVNINGIVSPVLFNVYDKIDALTIYETQGWKEVKEMSFAAGENYEIQLRAVPYADENELLFTGDNAKWELSGNIGTISPNGYFILNANPGESGSIKISVGGITKEIPVSISNIVFYDIDGHWAQQMIYSLAEDKIFGGIENENGTGFFPDNNMTRAEFAMTMCRYLGLDISSYEDTALNFADAASIQPWAQNAIRAVLANGIMTGRSNDGGQTVNFEPDSPITRAEAMTVMGRTIQDNNSYSFSFTDGADIPQWAANEIYKLAQYNIVQGYSDNTIKPFNYVTRAEAASLVYKLIRK